MDIMDYKSKMGSAILIAATGALFSVCIAYLINCRGKKRKSPDTQNDIQDTQQTEIDECRRLLAELRTKLDHETERRNESEAWNRKLEQDLVDLAGTRRVSEETCMRLRRDLHRVKGKLREAEVESRNLKLQLKYLKDFEGGVSKMPSAVQSVVYSDIYDQTSNVLTRNSQHSFGKAILTKTDISLENAGLAGNSPTSLQTCDASGRLCNDTIVTLSSNGFREHQIDPTNIRIIPPGERTHGYEDDYGDEDDFGYDEEDYSDYDEGDLPALQRSISQVSDDNFELGKDVMGALIANAFKDGVIASREGDDVSLSEELSCDQPSIAPHINGVAEPEHGEVSQESIGDTKTTRRFWEQMIAADKNNDDITDDDVSDEDGNVTDEDDDVTDEEAEPAQQTASASLLGGVELVGNVEDVRKRSTTDRTDSVTDRKQLESGENVCQHNDVIMDVSGVTISNGLHRESEL